MPLLVVGFTVAAFAIGATLRGTDVIVNQVAVVRAAPGTDAGQAVVYLGIFSPNRNSYDISIPGGALLSAPYNGEGSDQSGGQGLDVLQGDPAMVRQLAVGYGTLRAVRAEAPVTTPRIEADLRLEGDRVVGTIRNASALVLLKPAVVLGTGVLVLADIAPGATAKVDLRAVPDELGRQLSERIFGQQQWGPNGMPTGDFQRDQVRRQLVDGLTYDPFFGSSGTLPADGPVLLAWGQPGVFPVTVAHSQPRTAGETLYYLPMPLSATGKVTFTPDLMRSSLVEVKAQFFNKDPFNLNIGGGSVTLAYRPIPVAGRLATTRLALGINLGQSGPLGPAVGKPIEPGVPTNKTPAPSEAPAPAGTPAPSEAPASTAGPGEVTPAPQPAPDKPVPVPAPAPVPGDPTLPGIEIFDRSAGSWRPVDATSGRTLEIRDPSRFVDPSSGTVLLRLTNERQDAVSLQLAVQLEGEMQ
jgi:hypothetical protein